MTRLHRTIVTSFASVFLALSLAGCAALFSPRLQPVPITSTPEGAQVFVDDALVGTTPITLELDARTNYEVVVRHRELERRFTLASGVSGTMVALDVVPGLALAGLGVYAMAENDPGDAEIVGDFIGLLMIGTGVGSAALNVAIDASSGRWRRLAPREIVVVFD